MMGNTSSDSGESNPQVQEYVTDLIGKHPVVMFSKSYCPYCDMAKNALNSIGAKYEVIELNQRQDGSQIQNYLFRLTGQRTVPNVFIAEKSIGGGTETEQLQRSGQLKSLYDDAVQKYASK